MERTGEGEEGEEEKREVRGGRGKIGQEKDEKGEDRRRQDKRISMRVRSDWKGQVIATKESGEEARE